MESGEFDRICEPSRPDTVCAGPVLGTVFNWEKEREAGPGQTSMMEEEDVEVGPGDINTVVLAMRFTDDGEEEGQEEGAVQEDKNKEDAHGTDDSSLQVEEDWPVQNLELGQVSGVAVCPAGHVHVFHRGDRVWDSRTRDLDLAGLKLIRAHVMRRSNPCRSHLHTGTVAVITVRSSMKARIGGCLVPDLDTGPLHPASAPLTIMFIASAKRGTGTYTK
uniref:Uncharacterized protein n=1 Tax=Branchiostoma floridae TaxID=7739 RepID=C3YQ69_BRAFL|eukprot:XP_002601561.1 hypothetical protein BRAFLDRAFT_95800 [Branchiostoma floridae]